MSTIRLLILEMRSQAVAVLSKLLPPESGITIVGTGGSRDDALKLVERLNPNIVALGIDEPQLPPHETVRRIMIERPTPIVLVTDGSSMKNIALSMSALRDGALTVMSIPRIQNDQRFDFARARFVAQLKAMSEVKLVRRWRDSTRPIPPLVPAAPGAAGRAIAIAASTGGPAALHLILASLTVNRIPPILIVQHIAEGYVGGLAQWLDQETALTVKVASHGDVLKPNTVYLAPDARHLTVSLRGRVALSDDPPVECFRPSADVLFESAARAFGASLTAVMLTGMGCDGVRGLRHVRERGGRIIAQDEASAAVFGMPKAAAEEGLVDEVMALPSIAAGLASIAAVPA